MTIVEQGETLLVIRHGHPIAQVSPITESAPSWKRAALRLSSRGASLSAAILGERAESAP